MLERIEATGRTHPVPAISARQLARMEAEAARQRAIEEQAREEQGLAALQGGDGKGCGDGCAAVAAAEAQPKHGLQQPVEQPSAGEEQRQAALAGA